MAETAKIVSPDKIVIHPNENARCPMAAMVDVESLEALKREHPNAAVVAYVNTSAAVKAHTDICCTSSNAVKIIKNLKEHEILFIPDTNLGKYITRFIPNKDLIIWPGICPTHHKIKKEDILRLKKLHPSAEILVHPECNPDVIDISDFVYSTSGMIHHVTESSSDQFIIGTEKELCYRIQKDNLTKNIYSIEKALCPNMKKITLAKIWQSMQKLKSEVCLEQDIIEKAQIPLQRMIDMGRGD
jgi:quinolinate synthase